jgi:hypothetical protein
MKEQGKAIGVRSLGGIAQLGEHLLCKQGVVGSIPTVSTQKHISDSVISKNKRKYAKVLAATD